MQYPRYVVIQKGKEVGLFAAIKRIGFGQTDFDKLSDDEMAEYEEICHDLRNPSQRDGKSFGPECIFAFTPEGEKRHQRLIELTSKIVDGKVVRKIIDSKDFNIIYEDKDQVVLQPNSISKRSARIIKR